MNGATAERPVLWHLAMSHYNEKVRWALDLKRIPHVRRAVMPGVHQLVAKRKTGGLTFPILDVEGRSIGESAAIVEKLEQIKPDPPLYPADPGLKAEAIALERRFDTLLAPAIRRVLYQEVLSDRDFTAGFLAVGGNEDRRRLAWSAHPMMAPAMRSAFRVPPADDRGPREVVLEQTALIGELSSPGGYLVGDSFTVADLAACSFLIPFVGIEAMPAAMPELPEPLAEFGRELAAMPGGRWVSNTYRRHRNAQ